MCLFGVSVATMELLFGYFAGLLTLINPCVLPVLPIVLAGAINANRFGPVALAAGMSVSFVALGLGISIFGRAIGLDAEYIAQAGAVLMIGFGLVLLVPRLNALFSTATSGFAAQADGLDRRIARGHPSGELRGQFLGGALLGAVWSPCVGPTLGGAISLASQGQSVAWAGAIMVAFSAGVSTVILALGYGARSALQRRQAVMRRIAQRSKPIMGVVFIAVGTMILLRWHHIVEGWLLDVLPYWLTDFSVSV